MHRRPQRIVRRMKFTRKNRKQSMSLKTAVRKEREFERSERERERRVELGQETKVHT